MREMPNLRVVAARAAGERAAVVLAGGARVARQLRRSRCWASSFSSIETVGILQLRAQLGAASRRTSRSAPCGEGRGGPGTSWPSSIGLRCSVSEPAPATQRAVPTGGVLPGALAGLDRRSRGVAHSRAQPSEDRDPPSPGPQDGDSEEGGDRDQHDRAAGGEVDVVGQDEAPTPAPAPRPIESAAGPGSGRPTAPRWPRAPRAGPRPASRPTSRTPTTTVSASSTSRPAFEHVDRVAVGPRDLLVEGRKSSAAEAQREGREHARTERAEHEQLASPRSPARCRTGSRRGPAGSRAPG